jgi:hypothetical protein
MMQCRAVPSLELREGFSQVVEAALPKAQKLLEDSVERLLNSDQDHRA